MRSPVLLLLLVLPMGSIKAYAQTAPSGDACETPEVRAAFDTTLSQEELTKLSIAQRTARRQQVVDALLAKYPHEYLLYREQLNVAGSLDTKDHEAPADILRKQWESNAKAHPDDPMALMLAGKALADAEPEEAIRLFESARTRNPGFPWPYFELANLYWTGRYADEAKLKESLEGFYSRCPAWVDATSFGKMIEGFKLRKDPSLIGKIAIALRADLAQQTDPIRLEDYQILWQREFLSRPPAEHDAERAQIRLDLERLEKLVPHGDATWRLFLIEGYKLSGAANDVLEQMRSQAAKDFPHQSPAERLVRDQWNEAHPQPEGQKDAAAWKAYYAAKIEHVKQLMREFPDDAYLQRTEFYFTVQDDPYVSEADGLAALDLYQKSMSEYAGYGIMSTAPMYLAKFLLEHGWQPQRALDILKETSTYKNGGHTQEHWSKHLDEATVKSFHRDVLSEDLATLGLVLEAAELAHRPDEAIRFRAVIEEPLPENKKSREQYWTNRARFAVLDQRPEDALVYYRAALDARTAPPEYEYGILKDPLLTEFHTLWTERGGTETAWSAWNSPVVADSAPEQKKNAEAKVAAQESNWKQVTDKMPSFELSDFSGKKVRQVDFVGKVVVAVSWATWCAPCRMQDALLQKFYNEVKGRSDVAVVSLNVDENPGEVLPFMHAHGYTFPALAASSYSESAQRLVPRTWIIDKEGNWRWVKDGYDESKTYAEFEKDLLSQIGKAEAGQ